ncbi:hypothetical protein LCGC14_0175750 [marine sediment metagenome]|uniref:Uncharacterized protein n=1 Tax=marine sediment metagenome TaxID=412755 RepID=A0A0F9X9P1_9ZZZZ
MPKFSPVFDDEIQKINVGLYDKHTHFGMDEIFEFREHLISLHPYHQSFVRTIFEIYRYEPFTFISANEFGLTIVYPKTRFRGPLKRINDRFIKMDIARTDGIELTTQTKTASLYDVVEATIATIALSFSSAIHINISYEQDVNAMVNDAMKIMGYPQDEYFSIFFLL